MLHCISYSRHILWVFIRFLLVVAQIQFGDWIAVWIVMNIILKNIFVQFPQVNLEISVCRFLSLCCFVFPFDSDLLVFGTFILYFVVFFTKLKELLDCSAVSHWRRQVAKRLAQKQRVASVMQNIVPNKLR